MISYSEFRPTPFDAAGLGCEDKQDWLVAPVSISRDGDPLAESNWNVALKELEAVDTGEDMQVHRFGHWGPGWFEIILVRPGSKCAEVAEDIEAALADYPVLDDCDFSEREHEAAMRVWRHCYTATGRVEYIRAHRSQFHFHNFAHLLTVVRGEDFTGYASELLS